MFPAGSFFATLKFPLSECSSFSEAGSDDIKLSDSGSYVKLMFRSTASTDTAVFDISVGSLGNDNTIVYTKVISGLSLAFGSTAASGSTYACNDISVTADYINGDYTIVGGASGTANDNKFIAFDCWGAQYIRISCTTASTGAGAIKVDMSEI